jgi:hypothetical protein
LSKSCYWLREVLKHVKALVFGNYESNLGHFFWPISRPRSHGPLQLCVKQGFLRRYKHDLQVSGPATCNTRLQHPAGTLCSDARKNTVAFNFNPVTRPLRFGLGTGH